MVQKSENWRRSICALWAFWDFPVSRHLKHHKIPMVIPIDEFQTLSDSWRSGQQNATILIFQKKRMTKCNHSKYDQRLDSHNFFANTGIQKSFQIFQNFCRPILSQFLIEPVSMNQMSIRQTKLSLKSCTFSSWKMITHFSVQTDFTHFVQTCLGSISFICAQWMQWHVSPF